MPQQLHCKVSSLPAPCHPRKRDRYMSRSKAYFLKKGRPTILHPNFIFQKLNPALQSRWTNCVFDGLVCLSKMQEQDNNYAGSHQPILLFLTEKNCGPGCIPCSPPPSSVEELLVFFPEEDWASIYVFKSLQVCDTYLNHLSCRLLHILFVRKAVQAFYFKNIKRQDVQVLRSGVSVCKNFHRFRIRAFLPRLPVLSVGPSSLDLIKYSSSKFFSAFLMTA